VIGGVFGWYWGVAIVIFGTICVWMGATARASVKQRDEARNMVEQQREPSDSKVNDAIRLLQTESLVTKHNNGEERSYSFAQVFLSISDQLSVGISLNRFEEKIRKGLHIDDYGGWYFPSEADGITHLIGMLVQNALVDCRIEEDQHVTRELVSGVAGIYLTPDAHLVKNTEVKYYLSPFGSRVVQQLRHQSTAHKEGSAIPNTLKLPQPPELHISYQKHKFGVFNGEPIITVYAEYRPTGTMRIEAIELQLVGRSEPSLDWEVYEVKEAIWITSDNKFKVPDGISSGEHEVTLAAFANGEWWGSHPFTIAFPEVNS